MPSTPWRRAASRSSGLAARFLLAGELDRMPKTSRKVTRADLVAFFEARARELTRGD